MRRSSIFMVISLFLAIVAISCGNREQSPARRTVKDINELTSEELEVVNDICKKALREYFGERVIAWYINTYYSLPTSDDDTAADLSQAKVLKEPISVASVAVNTLPYQLDEVKREIKREVSSLEASYQGKGYHIVESLVLVDPVGTYEKVTIIPYVVGIRQVVEHMSSTSDIAGPNISALQALEYVTKYVSTVHNDTLQNHDLVDVVGSYYTCLRKPDVIFHRFPEWLFTFRERNTRNLLIFKVSDSRLPRAPDIDVLSFTCLGCIAYYSVVKRAMADYKVYVNVMDELGRVTLHFDGQGPEDGFDEVMSGANVMVLARSQVINEAIEQTNKYWKLELPNALGEIRIRQAAREGNKFYSTLMPIKGWKVDVQEAVQIAIAKGAKGLKPGRPGVVRLYNGRWRSLNGTYLTGAYWILPHRIGQRAIRISASSGQLYASDKDKLIFDKF